MNNDLSFSALRSILTFPVRLKLCVRSRESKRIILFVLSLFDLMTPSCSGLSHRRSVTRSSGKTEMDAMRKTAMKENIAVVLRKISMLAA